VWGRKNMMRDI